MHVVVKSEGTTGEDALKQKGKKVRKTRIFMLAALFLCAAASSALARYAWFWTLPLKLDGTDDTNAYFYLTNNNGSHAVAMTEYGDHDSVWTSILTQRWNPDWDHYNSRQVGFVRAFEYEDIGADWRHWAKSGAWPFVPDTASNEQFRALNCHVANNALFKTYTWGNINLLDTSDYPDGYGTAGLHDDPNLTYQNEGAVDFWDPAY